MVSGFICGSNSFPREEDEYERHTRSAASKKNKNLYSNRGLDKFSALLAELEEKRQQIYTRFDPDNVSLVRFVYSSDDHDLKPIVVKVKPENHDKPQQKLHSSSSMVVVNKDVQNVRNNKNKNNKMGFYRKLRVYQWKEPKFYLPMVVILILLVLVIFGRSFAIMCTSIGWYVIPTITNNGNNSSNLSFKKKDYANNRRLSEKKLKMTTEGTTSFKSPVSKQS